MSNQTRQFNEGELTSNTIDRQFTPEFVSKAIVEQPGRQTIFLDRGNRDKQPENHGDTFTMEVRYPVLHKDNMIDGGIDANGSQYLGNVWYVYLKSGVLDSSYSADTYMAIGAAAEGDLVAGIAAAKAAAVARVAVIADSATLKSGAGSVRNGSNSYLVEKDVLVPIPEMGGQMNEVNGTSKLVSAKVSRHGANSKYTVLSTKLDSRLKLVGRTIQDLGRFRKEAQEGQARASVIAASEVNRLLTSAIATTPSEMDGSDVLTFAAFEAWEQDIQNAEIPLQTTIVSGSSKIDTRVVDGAYIVYIAKELVPTLRKIKGPDNTTVWIPKAQYDYAAGKDMAFDGLKGEVGALEGLPFRFVVVQDMPTYKGQGGEVGKVDADPLLGDSGSATAQASAYSTASRYDVFPLVVIGDDAYTTLSYSWGNVVSSHVPPVRDIVNDIYATKGAIVTEWSYGFLVYRPERIRQMATIVRRDGLTS